jgi:hypothetical protein
VARRVSVVAGVTAVATRRGAVVVAVALGLAGAIAGCGPSFQAIYEGDSRFEHCYALEENASVAMQQKGACWQEWLRHYTYGQTRDRVEYAAARSRALSAGVGLPTDEAMMGAAPGEGRRIGTAPAPTNAFAPPPKTLSELDGGFGAGPNATSAPSTWGAAPMPTSTGTTAASTPSGPSRPPLADCTDRCGVTWTSCKSDCDSKPDKKKACDGCEKTYKACIKTCAR